MTLYQRCPYCDNIFPREEIIEHVTSCEQNEEGTEYDCREDEEREVKGRG